MANIIVTVETLIFCFVHVRADVIFIWLINVNWIIEIRTALNEILANHKHETVN